MPYRIGQGSGTLSTAGGVLFHGEPDGNILALDARTGKELWRWQTGFGADAPAVTYELDGQQYVAIATGGVSLIQASQNGDAVWAFTLNGKLAPFAAPFAAPPAPATEVAFTGAVTNASAVRMGEFNFTPARIQVTAGTTVTWTNAGSQAHTATSADGGWDTGEIAPGQTATVTLDQPGTFTYLSSPHPWMIGQIIVDARP
jgi:plastocyanin